MIIKSISTISKILQGKKLFTSIQTDRPYQEIGRAQHFNLVVPGFIVGIEKRSIFKSDKTPLEGLASTTRPYEPRFRCKRSAQNSALKPDPVFTRATSTLISKVMLASQITKSVSFEGNHYTQYLHNAYGNNLQGQYHFEESFSKVDAMFADMALQLKSAHDAAKPFTHILVMSMGWNNDQVESLYRYNTILKNLQQEALANKQPFKPMVVCFTWPSVWGGVTDSIFLRTLKHLFSYVNKSDDADEVGFTWGNWVVNKKIPETLTAAGLDSAKPKVVLIGHSFGARLLSRALFSAEFIDDQYPIKNCVDVFIGLQGAFSLRRFVAGAGVEGDPYADFKNLPSKIVLTTSTHDISNRAAIWAANAGGPQGLRFAQNKPEVFSVTQWNPNNPQLTLEADKINLVDASTIVQHESDEIDAHNDILDAEMAKIIWAAIH